MAAVTPPVFQTRLQFVLVNDKSASQKKVKDERKAIHSHVMLEMRRKERAERAVRYQRDITSLKQRRLEIEEGRFTQDQAVQHNSQIQGLEDGICSSSTTLRRQYVPTKQEPYSISRRQFHKHSYLPTPEDSGSDDSSDFSSYPSPTIYLGGGDNDPFCNSVIRLDSRRHGLIQYFVSVCMPSLYVMEGSHCKKWSRSTVLKDEVRRCTHDATRCYSTLAMASSFAELRRYNNSQSRAAVSPSQETVHFKIRAVQELKKTLSTEAANLSLIWSVIMLLACECFVGNVQAQRVHLKGLSQLLDVLGGFQVLPLFLSDNVIITDVNSAIPILARPIFPLTWAPPPIPNSIRDQFIPPEPDNPIRTINNRFETPSKRSILPDELLQILRDVRDITLMAKHAIVHGVSQHTDLLWLNYQILAIEHRLLSLSFFLHDPRQAMLKCIQITTLLFINTTDVDQMPDEALQALLPALEEALCHTDLASFWGPHLDILFWALSFGAFVGEGLPESSWFEVQLARVASHMRLMEWKDVQSLLLPFFYVDCIHDVSFTEIWERIRQLMRTMGFDDGLPTRMDGVTIDPSVLLPGKPTQTPTRQKRKSPAMKDQSPAGSDVRLNAMMLRVTTNCHPRGFQAATLPKSMH